MTTIEVRGVRVPAVGFGTWLVTGQDATDGVRDALEIGYRQIDTARAYENEREVGRGIAESGVPRNEIFITTKVPHDEATADEVDRDADQSLERLGIDQLDLLLLHWPSPDVPLEETLKALDRVREDGRARQIGVSNFPAGLLQQALEIAPVFCNQVEYHPFLDQSRLLQVARENDVLITAYSPLAHGKVPGDEALTRIGGRYGKTAGQVALRWLLDQPGVSPIPKASSHDRRQENFDVLDFTLDDEDRREIDGLPKDVRTANPPWAPDWDA
jgi:diketogulonate reductase-like aldo/keto reductase